MPPRSQPRASTAPPLHKLRHLRARDALLLVEAAAWVLVARAAIVALPFRFIARTLGKHMGETTRDPSTQPELARRIGWAARIASRYLPARHKCLGEAIAAQRMLRRRGLSCTLYLGVARDTERALAAHAWLRCGATLLTGRDRATDYAVVTTFACEARS